MSNRLDTRVQQLRMTMRLAELDAKRTPGSTHLLAVSKKHPISAIQDAFDAGLRDFGESTWQEARDKIHALEALPICWHFIGPIQSNKAKYIAKHFSWVHSLCRADIAEKLNRARPESLPPLNVCIQVNLDNEATKSGILLEQLESLARVVLNCPRLTLRGLMIIPKPCTDDQTSYAQFKNFAHEQASLAKNLQITLDSLSMGMSYDFKAAIRAGSTWVRIGRGIFGNPEL
ncbi:MAG: YggS family pyridoxal phosphate-dependent enzyme [Legionellaceae bacterium]|nr:YggS family pyridoxal phosphate-dependent enzyme [Legionellaceae bacterium]